MRLRRFLRSVCALLLMSMGVMSCTTPTEESKESLESVEQITISEADEGMDLSNAVQLICNGETEYLIVYPAANENMEKDIADRVRAELISATGVRLSCVADDSIAAKKSEGKEILIGLTNREESIAAHATLRSRDYSAVIRGDKIVLAGQSFYMLINAYEAFREHMVSRDGSVYSNCNVQYTASYTAKNPCINGVSLGEYRIVYQNRSDAKEMASAIRAILETDTGYMLPCVTDAEAPQAYEILVGDTNRAESDLFYGTAQHGDAYRITCENGKLVIGWGNAGILHQVNKAFYSGFLKLVYGSTVDLAKISAESDGTDYNGNEFSIMTYNAWNVYRKANQALNRADLTASILYSYQPDVIGLQEYDDIYRLQGNDVIGQMEPLYAEAVPSTAEKAYNWNPILYRTDRLELVDCGHEVYTVGTEYNIEDGRRSHFRSFTWAVLRVKETGKTVTVFNTHLDTARENQPAECAQLWARIQTVYGSYGGALFLIGDYNCPIPGPGVNALKGYGFLNTYDLAVSRTDTCLGHQAPVFNAQKGQYVPSDEATTTLAYANSVDHCMFYGTAPTVLRFESSSLADMLSVSDHSPVYVSMKLN
ncbi:MAG: hypothetical protein IKC59_01925 [Clostridia bacterium]|nr:hypothetical protein [Clostridia bacterium]